MQAHRHSLLANLRRCLEFINNLVFSRHKFMKYSISVGFKNINHLQTQQNIPDNFLLRWAEEYGNKPWITNPTTNYVFNFINICLFYWFRNRFVSVDVLTFKNCIRLRKSISELITRTAVHAVTLADIWLNQVQDWIDIRL